MKVSTPSKLWIFFSSVSLLLGGGSGAGTVYYLVRATPEIARPDPFTGSEARSLDSRIQKLENRELPPQWLIKEMAHIHMQSEENKELIRDFREEQSRRTPMIEWIESRMKK